jgi:hypothetical protein
MVDEAARPLAIKAFLPSIDRVPRNTHEGSEVAGGDRALSPRVKDEESLFWREERSLSILGAEQSPAVRSGL